MLSYNQISLYCLKIQYEILYMSGQPLVFEKFLPGFWVYFQFKVKFKVKNCVLNSITTLKRYCKGTLNMLFNKKKLMMTKFFYLYDRFFVSNQNFTI